MSCRKFASHSSASDSAEEEGGKAEQKSQTVQPFGEIRFCEGATPLPAAAASSTLHFVES